MKNIGEEVLFAADDALSGADIVPVCRGWAGSVDANAPIRIGLAFGAVLHRFGDVFGEPVNLAARLPSMADPGSTGSTHM